MVDYQLQRRNMVESQVRPSDVTDRRVLRAMQEIAREAFVPASLKATAYMDQDLVLAAAAPGRTGRALLAPRLMAKLIQHLEIGDDDTVLEVGTGTGYGAALLSRIARKVVALESDPQLATAAQAALLASLAPSDAAKVEVVTGPLPEGVPAKAPYAAIILSGSVPQTPPELLDQLLDGGRLTVVETGGGVGRLMQWRRTGRSFGARPIMEANAPQLPGFERERGFVF